MVLGEDEEGTCPLYIKTPATTRAAERRQLDLSPPQHPLGGKERTCGEKRPHWGRGRERERGVI